MNKTRRRNQHNGYDSVPKLPVAPLMTTDCPALNLHTRLLAQFRINFAKNINNPWFNEMAEKLK